MNVLSSKMIGKYNYPKVKEYVEDELFNITFLGTKLMCLLPPDAGRQICTSEKVDSSHALGSKQEKYVEKKDYLEREIEKEKALHQESFELMTDEEITIFEETFIYQLSDLQIEDKYTWSNTKINRLRKSFMIKFALSKGMDFEK